MTDTNNAGSVETLKDFGEGPEGIAKRYAMEIDLYDEEVKAWLDRARKISDRYRDTRQDPYRGARKYNLLWANVEVQKPILYARAPKADVQRRFKDADPVGRLACELSERVLDYFIDCDGRFDAAMRETVEDRLISGQGVTWQRYVPHFKSTPTRIPVNPVTPQAPEGAAIADDGLQVNNEVNFDNVTEYRDEEGNVYAADTVKSDDNGAFVNGPAQEEIEYEEVLDDYVNYADWGRNAGARTWDEVYLVWRKAYLTRDELHARFDGPVSENLTGGDLGAARRLIDEIPLDHTAAKSVKEKDQNLKDIFKKATIYELWDRSVKKAVWLNKNFSQGPLDSRKDPLKLSQFFPCPKPIWATQTNDSLVVVPDFVFYQDQAEEIDAITARIALIDEAIIVRGLYPANVDALRDLLTTAKNLDMIPVSQATMTTLGGMGFNSLEKIVYFWPIDILTKVLNDLVALRNTLINDVYQITGLSDLIRGQTDPNETYGAQQLKSQWGSLRVREAQHEVQRFARDALRIKFEIVFNHFADETLWLITNAQEIPDIQAAGKQAAAQFAKQWQQQEMQRLQMLQAQQAPMLGHNGGPPMNGGMMPQAAPAMPAPQPQPPPPELLQQAEQQGQRQAFNRAMALLRNKALRHFRVDIETDSTVAPDEQAEQKSMSEFMTAFGTIVAQAAPALEKAPELMPVFGEIIKQGARRFKFASSFENTIDTAVDAVMRRATSGGGGEGQAEQAAKMAEAKAEQDTNATKRLEVQQRAQETQTNAAVAQQEMAVKREELAVDAMLGMRDPAPNVTVQ